MTKNNINESLPYRHSIGMMIINDAKEIFVGQRCDTKFKAFQMPQGGILPGETPSKAALREMQEELGTDQGYIISESHFWYSYDLPKPLVSKLWNGQFRGQKQKWFLIRFTGSDLDIHLNQTNLALKPEFESWKWVNVNELVEMVIPFKKKLYEAVINEFYHALCN